MSIAFAIFAALVATWMVGLVVAAEIIERD